MGGGRQAHILVDILVVLAVYVRLDDSSIVESEEVHPGIVLDFNGANQVVRIELLTVKDRVPGDRS